MKILITGSNGMVGRSLIKKLEQSSDIKLLVPTRHDLNLLNQEAVNNYFIIHQPEMIIHLAARVGGIQANILNPVEFLTENVLMNTFVIASALAQKIPRLLFIGSSCMYPKGREMLHESDMLTGLLEPTNEGYALAKISGASLCKYINQQYGLSYKTIVPCNLYGPYDNFNPIRSHLIPAMIRKLHNGKQQNINEVSIWGNGAVRREFMFVDDLSEFILLAIKQIDNMPQQVNVGLGYDYTINEYYQIAAKIIHFQGKLVHDLDKPSGMQRKLLNVDLAKTLGWQANFSIEVGLQKTYDYFLSLSED
ncbi:MAG TPA: GDP-L-fucose synthase [Gammaproteobacteria bacterium]|nr:GDP-L-fucose synthase [Gammaproteobacteria bacterium]